ncbi:NADH-quinone oxidoreductase subunit C [Lapillicoccus sp.]|uniref:NADH-quinone oxidoreductase subunit C n=1 Tax=Lapillicoccus sp. TaxID=1909287 RepID=UPI003264B218
MTTPPSGSDRAGPARDVLDDVLEVAPGEWQRAVADARDRGLTFFDWLTAVDQLDAEDNPGFDVVVHLLDVSTPGSLKAQMIRTRLAEGAPLASLTPVFAGAAWHERETHEMFGIDLTGFDDGTGLGLRPLLLPDGFEGTPLRKSFVLAARASKPWPGAKEPGEGHDSARAPGRRRVQAPGVPPPEWGPR